MTAHQKNNNTLRFFSNSSIVKDHDVNKVNDPKPFGLNYQEQFSLNSSSPQQGITAGASPTNTPSGSDSCLDVDYEF